MVETKEFKIEDILQRIPVNKIPHRISEMSKVPTEDCPIPAIAAGTENQGIACYVSDNGVTVLKNVISISANGDGSAFYQHDSFTIMQDAYAVETIDREMTEEVGLYLVGTIQKLLDECFGWNNKSGWNKLKERKIPLPVTPDGTPDWDYMQNYIAELEQNYIAELEQNYIAELEQYLIAAGLNDYTLTDEDMRVLEEAKTKEMREFRVGDLFDVKTTKNIDRNKFSFDESGEYDFIGRSQTDYGIQGKVTHMGYEPNPAKTFSVVQIGETCCLYRENEWYASQNIFALKPKFENSEKVHLYITSAMNKAFIPYASAYIYPTLSVLEDTKIILPSTPDSTPDWNFMSAYIRATEKLVIQDVVDYKNTFITQAKTLTQYSN